MAEAGAAVPGVIVVGASAGGVEALSSFVAALPADLPAPVVVVLHVAPTTPSVLPSILNRSGILVAEHITTETALNPRRIYVAPPDHHLKVTPTTIQPTRDARENGVRPAIDVLFRSAAEVFGAHTIAVVLSGSLDDGAAGLAAVLAAGGTTMVQDPSEAAFPSMPISAIQYGHPQFVGKAAELAAHVAAEARRWATKSAPIPRGDAVNDSSDPASAEQQEGQPSELTCPECGGTLWEREDNGLLRFRCRVGHAYSPESMMVEQQRSLEQSLWAAVVALEERADLASRVEERMRRMGNAGTAERYRLRAQVARQHAQQVRAAIGGNEPDLDDATQ